ncbi:MAG TPA: DUF2834 domain-containing protein [Rhodobacteraceae bacterium]|nr:DUF2834 domain-containing protein [Paracoccaceae bacterium]
MSKLRILYLILTIIGAIVPMFFMLGWMQGGGAVTGLVAAWSTNGASTGLMWDLIISASVFTVFAISECMARRDYFPLVALPATVMIGLSCGLPLYLFLRTRARA